MGATASINLDQAHSQSLTSESGTPSPSPFAFPLLGLRWTHWTHFLALCGGPTHIANLSVRQLFEQVLKPLVSHYRCSYCQLLHNSEAQEQRESERDGERQRDTQSKTGRANVYVVYSWEMNFLEVMRSIESYIEQQRVLEESAREGEAEPEIAAEGSSGNIKAGKKRSFSYSKPEEIVLWMDIFSFDFCEGDSEQHVKSVAVEPSTEDVSGSEAEVKMAQEETIRLAEEEEKLMWDTKFKVSLDLFDQVITVCLSPPWRFINLGGMPIPPSIPISPRLSPRATVHQPTASPFNRTWCLYEVYCSMIDNLQFDIAMSPAVLKDSIDDMLVDVDGCIDHLVNDIDFIHSRCGHGKSQQRIFDVVRLKIGISTVNMMIYEQIRFWMVDVLTSQMKKESEELAKLPYQLVLGHIYRLQGAMETAETLYSHCYESYKESFGVDHNDTLSSLFALATLYDLQSEFDKAEALYHDILKHRLTKDGASHSDTLSVMTALGNLYRTIGDYEQAETMLLSVWKERKAVVSTSSASVLSKRNKDYFAILTDLVQLYKDMKNYDKAETFAFESFQLKSQQLGDDSSETLSAMNQLGNLYYDMNAFNKAEFYYHSCWKKREKLLGEDHLLTLTTMNNLANLYLAMSQQEKESSDDAQEEKTSQPSDDQERAGEDRRDDAELLYQECVRIRRTTYGDNHPDTLTALFNLASFYEDSSNIALRKAMELSDRVEEEHKQEQKLDQDQDIDQDRQLEASLSSALANAALIARELFRHYKLKAEELYLDVLEKRKSLLGFTHAETLSTMQSVGLFYRQQGDWEMALALFTNVHEFYQEALGDDHPETLLATYNLAIILEEMRNFEKAENLFNVCFDIYSQRLGLNHEDTLSSVRHLMSIYRETENVEKMKMLKEKLASPQELGGTEAEE